MPESSRSRLAIGIGLAVLTIAAYARVAGNGFINLDDNDYVTASPHVQAGLTCSSIRWAFTTGHSANWHPLTWLSHMLDVQLYGMNAGGHHLTSLALHVASTLLLFHLFLKTTGALYPSAFVAAVFGLHPLHVESVAWVAERKDVLSAFFWILTTLAYVEWTKKPQTSRYLLVVVLFALGLMSKPMLVTLPFALLLLDVWPLRRPGAPFVREKIPLFLLAGASSVVTFLVQRAQGAMTLSDRIPIGLRVENALVSYAAYLGKAVVPARLAVYYPHTAEAYPAWQVAGAALLLGGITWFAWRSRDTRPWLVVGWLWFVGTLVPVIGLVQVGSQSMADRYTYVPLIGLSAAVAFEAAEVRGALAVLLLVGAAAWSALTWRQVGFWKDDRTLFGNLVQVMPENHLAHHILGCVYLREHRLDEAVEEFKEALRLRPTYAEASSNLGMALELSGKPAEAIEQYEGALRESPELAEAHHNLGRLLATQGHLEAAIPHLEAAVKSNPDLVEAHVNLGSAYMMSGRIDEAISRFEKALELRPGSADVQRRLDAARAAGRRN
jgi:tetratricopeptide (TPR) repeat protein